MNLIVTWASWGSDMSWRPIATAPKDRPVLLRGGTWDDDLGGPYPIGMARWHETTRYGQTYGMWAVAISASGFDVIDYDGPTEWMDLGDLP